MIYVGKKAGAHTLTQDQINALLVEKAGAGNQVVRLKGGDPFVFGRGGEEAAALAQAKIPFEVVPGVTSAIAGPAYAGIPVTHRGQNSHVTFFTGHEDPEKAESSIDFEALGETRRHASNVDGGGTHRSDREADAFRRRAARPAGGACSLGDDRAAGNPRGKSVGHRAAREGFRIRGSGGGGFRRSRSVAKRAELVRGAAAFRETDRCDAHAAASRSVESGNCVLLGADVSELPTIRIEPPSDLRAFAELVQDAHAYDWIVFTSPNGVTAFFDLFFKLYDDAREIGATRIAAIGPATAQRMKDYHLHVDLQPEEFVAEAVVARIPKTGGSGEFANSCWLVRRRRGTCYPNQLSALGAIVDQGFAYRTVAETRDVTGARRRLLEEGADLITFTSSSTVENFLALGLPWPEGMQIASIGPITSKTACENAA